LSILAVSPANGSYSFSTYCSTIRLSRRAALAERETAELESNNSTGRVNMDVINLDEMMATKKRNIPLLSKII
jgi:hypothetical protein